MGGTGDNGRRFSTQLQGDWHQVFGGGAQYLLADAAGAGEQQMVERQAAECLANLGTTDDHGDLIFGIGRADQPGKQG
ncbi:hypothetical protein D3C78_1345130 [compost metagenome]